ncbi:hypothetical protein FVE85_1178 [Porphyridium purpureum]|uniref:Uncharacterized protein n=1 Tax=Porphyridium purpureum TaxID=35688 RepID=A0A5J4Z0P1_PORPP|nr:hypothetical protein FVE85_1178 [Porphyridium purpureum]|eukprot:POR0588..scf208_2
MAKYATEMARMFPLAWAVAIALLATWSSLYTAVAQELCQLVEQSEQCLAAGTQALVPDAEGTLARSAVPASCQSGFPKCALQPCRNDVESEETQQKMVLEYKDVSELSLEFSASPVDIVVDCGDGTVTAHMSMGKFVHTYRRHGSCQVVISGSVGGIRFDDGLTAVSLWGELGLTTLNGAFYGMSSRQSVSADLPRTVTNLSCMFAESRFDGEIGTWGAHSVTSMSGKFDPAFFYRDVSEENVSCVASMDFMFASSMEILGCPSCIRLIRRSSSAVSQDTVHRQGQAPMLGTGIPSALIVGPFRSGDITVQCCAGLCAYIWRFRSRLRNGRVVQGLWLDGKTHLTLSLVTNLAVTTADHIGHCERKQQGEVILAHKICAGLLVDLIH